MIGGAMFIGIAGIYGLFNKTAVAAGGWLTKFDKN
jgi:hypothetical protein